MTRHPVDLHRWLEPLPRVEWMRDAACRDKDPELFFPGPGGPNYYPVRVCDSCPVTMDCLTYAARLVADGHVMYGIWAGRNIATMTRAQARLILSRGERVRRHPKGNGDSDGSMAAERRAP